MTHVLKRIQLKQKFRPHKYFNSVTMLCRNVKTLVRPRILARIMSTEAGTGQDKSAPKDERSTVDPKEIALHENLKHQWWDSNGSMKGLHSLNRLRVPFIRDGLLNTIPILESQRDTPLPLVGTKLLDVGCGGGILSEPLSRLGAEVTGLDASEQLISLAKEHSSQPNSLPNLNYVHDKIEDFCQKHHDSFDGVVASEIIEHINDKELFLASCIKTIKPGGSMFITTLNKSNLSWIGGILIAENVLKIVPQGTHRWDKFISPDDMSRLLDKYDCKTKLVHGMLYVFVNNTWYWTGNTSINYAIHAVKT